MPLAGRDANLLITSLTATTSTNEPCTRSTGAGTAPGYVQVTASSKRHLDPSTSHALYQIVGGTTSLVSSTAYTLNYVQGKFEWKSGDPSTGTYQADIRWLTASRVAGGRQWQAQVDSEMFEVTEFGSSGWRQYQPNMTGATVTISRYWADSTFIDYITQNARFLVELVVSKANGWKYEGFVYPQSNQIQAAVDSIVTEDVTMVVDGRLYFTT